MAKKQNIEIFFKINGLEAYIDDLETLNDTLDKVAKATKDASDEQEKLEKSSGKFGKVLGTIGKVGKTAFRGIGTAIKATGLGVFLGLGNQLLEWFNNTDAGAKLIQGSLAAVGVVFNKISDFVRFLIQNFTPLFQDPIAAIQGFGESIKSFVLDRIQALFDGIGLLGKSISALFKGEFSEAADLAADGFKKIAVEATLIGPAIDATKKVVEVATEEFKSFANEVVEAVQASNDLVDAQNKLEEESARLIVENAKLNQELETQKKIAEDTTRSYDERKAALDRVNAANEKLAKNAVTLAGLELETLERAKELANTESEERDLKGQIAEATAALTEAQTAQQLVRLESGQLSRELDEEELQRLEDLRLAEKKLADDKRDADEEERQRRIDNAKTVYGQIGTIAEAFAGDDEKRARIAFNFSKGLSLAEATMAGVEGVQNAFKTGQKSPITALFPPYPYIQAAAAGVFAAAKIKTIAATQFNPGGGGGGATAGLTSPGGGRGTSITAGANALTYQLGAGGGGDTLALGGDLPNSNAQPPQKVYVVSTDVSNAQEADKQIDNLARL